MTMVEMEMLLRDNPHCNLGECLMKPATYNSLPEDYQEVLKAETSNLYADESIVFVSHFSGDNRVGLLIVTNQRWIECPISHSGTPYGEI